LGLRHATAKVKLNIIFIIWLIRINWFLQNWMLGAHVRENSGRLPLGLELDATIAVANNLLRLMLQ
jgi:hypothetical protein